MENYEKYRSLAKKALSTNPGMVIGKITEHDSDQIVHIATDVMMARDRQIPTDNAGSFVRAILSDSLKQAVESADDVCIRAFQFFIYVNAYCHLSN